MSCSRLALVAVCVAVVAPRAARADSAAAEAAFAEGKRLMTAGKVAEACPKFELSHKEDPQLGTLLNLADCHEKLGRLATAWAEFRAAMELAHNRGDEREAYARDRADKLAPRVSKVVFEQRAGATGVHVELDGRDVTALIGVPIPVDPGEHSIATRSDEHATAITTIAVEPEGRTRSVTIPTESTAAFDGVEVEAAPVGSPGRTRKLVGFAVIGLGAVATTTGLYFGARARNRWNDSRAFCDDQNRCDAQGGRLVDDARSAATISTVLVGAGLAAAAIGTVVVLTAPRESVRSRVVAGPIVTPRLVGGALCVQF